MNNKLNKKISGPTKNFKNLVKNKNKFLINV